jgi:hypothetical protein
VTSCNSTTVPQLQPSTSLWGKCGELEILLETEINNVEVLCFKEHWLNCYKIHTINIKHFTLANAFFEKIVIMVEHIYL